MPTASGIGKSNYSTTRNLSKLEAAAAATSSTAGGGVHYSTMAGQYEASTHSDDFMLLNHGSSGIDGAGGATIGSTRVTPMPPHTPMATARTPVPPTSRAGFNANSKASNASPLPVAVHRSEYGTKGTHRRSIVVKPDSNAEQAAAAAESLVSIKDAQLREIVQKLVKSERDKLALNLDPNMITQINHRGHTLFYTKQGLNPFDAGTASKPPTEERQIQTDINASQIQSIDVTTASAPPIVIQQRSQTPMVRLLTPKVSRVIEIQQQSVDSQQATATTTTTTATALPTTLSFQDANGNIVTAELKSVSGVGSGDHTSTTSNNAAPFDEIPPEVARIIQQDMANNPSTGGERSYRVMISKQPDEPPQEVRIVVKNPPPPPPPPPQPLTTFMLLPATSVGSGSNSADPSLPNTYIVRNRRQPVQVIAAAPHNSKPQYITLSTSRLLAKSTGHIDSSGAAQYVYIPAANESQKSPRKTAVVTNTAQPRPIFVKQQQQAQRRRPK